jgi:uracil-DNA glycosylase
MKTDIEPTWRSALAAEFTKPYFNALTETVTKKYQDQTVYPRYSDIFNAFLLCPFSTVKVVILGQDPYHGEGQAHGLSFSVPEGNKIPPSLRNIYKELAADLHSTPNSSGDLRPWATQGVLLLNATLTVEADTPGSHQGLGWETFTDAVIKKISAEKSHCVFLLWGKYAQAKRQCIDETKHLVLTAPHPSPFSAYTGFFGCRHFSQTNEYLKLHKQKPIAW